MKLPMLMNHTPKDPFHKPPALRKVKLFLLVLLPMGLMLCTFLSSLIHTDGSTPGFGFIGLIRSDLQNALHIPMFFALTLILMIFLQRFEKRIHNRILFAFVLSNYVGILNEGLQMLIPGRNASLGDIWLNLVGTALGLVFYFGVRILKSTWKRGGRRF